jgi:pimeloyl-ACP methyl ester carboxylesterase
VALAPAGGWVETDESVGEMLDYFEVMQELLVASLPHVDAIVATAEGRRRVTEYITTRFEHLSVDLVGHLMSGAAACDGALPLIDFARRNGWTLDAERISCPVRVVWGLDDRLLEWPAAAARYRNEWLPHADWVELDGVGHCPQLDVPLETAQLIVGFTAR